jgi:hypothetical protein
MGHRDAGYRWVREWDRPADVPSDGMAHTSIVVTRAGEIMFGDSRESELVVVDDARRPVRRVALSSVGELHGLTLVEEDTRELLWVADTGAKFFGGRVDVAARTGALGGQVIQFDLDGHARRVLEQPPIEAYGTGQYAPTSIVVDEQRFDGSGDLWVSDGYGAGLVHRYDADGRYCESLDGTDGAGRFGEPHGLHIDRRGPTPELYVTDRQNRRIQVYDLDGRFKRAFGDDVLLGPSFMTRFGDRLLITDLLGGRVTIFDRDDLFVAHAFARPDPIGWEQFAEGWPKSGWPNTRAADGTLVRPDLATGSFNSPHGIAADDSGNVYVSEFVFGGRTVKLEPAAPA